MTEGGALGVGRALAEARQAQGLELADIAQQLKFMPRQIEALENERFDSLPGPTIARGMVRTYARFLKLEPEPLLEKMAGRVEVKDATPQLAQRFKQPVPFSDSGKQSTLVYLALSVVVLGIAAGVFYEWRRSERAPKFVAAAVLPEERKEAPVPPKGAPVSEVAMAEPAVASPKVPEKPQAKAPEKPPAKAPEKVQAKAPEKAPEKVAPAPVVTAPPPKVAEPRLAEAAPALPVVPAKDFGARTGAANRLVLRFEEDAWAEVVDSNGRSLISSLNRAGTERSVRVSPPFNVVIGNAQHVKVVYNDHPVDLAPHVKVEVARFTIK